MGNIRLDLEESLPECRIGLWLQDQQKVCGHSDISDAKIVFNNDKNEMIYRIINFTALSESYCLITNRFDLTTYQVIMLYAYRWQVELCFRFLKRTFKGIHLLTQDENGIQIQFYLYMIGYLILL